MSHKKTVIVLGVASVALIGLAAWMYQSKWLKESKFLKGQSNNLKTVEDKAIEAVMSSRSACGPAPSQKPYGCGSFNKDCAPGEVGGCQQYKETCGGVGEENNSVRLTMSTPGECDQFRRQCEMGDYGSCDMYNKACLHEDF